MKRATSRISTRSFAAWYALGIILYEMLCGAPPFTGGDPTLLLHRHLAEMPEPIGARRGEVLDDRLDAIVNKSLAKEPASRYATAEAMLGDLREYLNVLGVRQRAGTHPALMANVDLRAEAAASAFESLRLPTAGLHRDGRIAIANRAFARFVGAEDAASIEGTNVRRTALLELNPDLHDDLRLVALNGKVIRRNLTIQRQGRTLQVRYILAPAHGACGDCMLVLHTV